VTSGSTVSISCGTSGAAIYYSINGGSYVPYTGAITITAATTITAYATASGMTQSQTATASYTIASTSQVATPVISPASGSVASGTQVTISCSTSGATIYYSINSGSFVQYTGAITITDTTSIEAYATASGMNQSAYTSTSYTISSTSQVATPSISPSTGIYSTTQTVIITVPSGSTVYYTTDGSTPTTSSTEYIGSFTVSSTMTINAIAVESGMTNSAMATSTITISSSSTGTVPVTVE
jgi:uncharacterized Fe-S cluster protein YjdI